jgi:hypothetical protein
MNGIRMGVLVGFPAFPHQLNFFGCHTRGLLAPPRQLHKIYDTEPCASSKEPAAEDELRAHDRHLIAAFRSAHCYC